LYPADNSGPLRFEQSTGVFTINRPWTVTCNASNDTVTSAAERMGALLEKLHFTKF
jgi:hypothetical protein